LDRWQTFISPPTAHAEATLLSEGVCSDDVFLTGNTVIDTLLLTRDRVTQEIPEAARAIQSLTENTRVVLVTGHRRESHGQGFENICNAIRNVADKIADINFIYPVHLNPKVQEPVNRILGNHPRIHLVDPLSYEPFVWLLNQSDIVLTDSGGVQEEAPSFGKPVLVMRDTTERPEGVEAGNAKLVGTCQETIETELIRLLTNPAAYAEMADAQNPYGDGTASRQIADVLASQAVSTKS
jgi:UDP-N-acetylglucosamine 2-epimerase (non-hydrolysing)